SSPTAAARSWPLWCARTAGSSTRSARSWRPSLRSESGLKVDGDEATRVSVAPHGRDAHAPAGHLIFDHQSQEPQRMAGAREAVAEGEDEAPAFGQFVAAAHVHRGVTRDAGAAGAL